MIKSSEIAGSGSTYILKLEQIHMRKSFYLRQKTYFLLSKGSKSLIITFFLFTELNSIKNLELEQIQMYESFLIRLARFSGHKKTYFLLSEGSNSLIITFFLFTELNFVKNITMLKNYLSLQFQTI